MLSGLQSVPFGTPLDPSDPGSFSWRVAVAEHPGPPHSTYKLVCCKGRCPGTPSAAAHLPPDADGYTRLLYDTIADPFDMTDRRAALPHVAAALQAELPVVPGAAGFDCSGGGGAAHAAQAEAAATAAAPSEAESASRAAAASSVASTGMLAMSRDDGDGDGVGDGAGARGTSHEAREGPEAGVGEARRREIEEQHRIIAREQRAADELARKRSGPPRACRRRSSCSGAPPSAIFVEGLAGLGDWAFRLEATANLAATLCAQVIPPPPAEALHPKHNGGRALPRDVPWDRYMSFVVDDDDGGSGGSGGGSDGDAGSSVVNGTRGGGARGDGARGGGADGADEEAKAPPPHPHHPLVTDEASWRAAEARLEAPHRAALSLRADTLEQVLEQYDRLAAAVAAGERWQWRLPLGFWKWNAALAAHIAARGEYPPRSLADPHNPEEPGAAERTGACGYGRVVAGRGVREKVRSLLKALNSTEETAAQLVALHVRRGDSADGSLNYWCNSTVPAVLGYLACPAVASHLKAFVEGLPGYPSTPARLVLVTDEKDASYLNELIGKLNEMPLWRGSAAGVTHVVSLLPHRSLRLLSPALPGPAGYSEDDAHVVAMPGGLRRALAYPDHMHAPEHTPSRMHAPAGAWCMQTQSSRAERIPSTARPTTSRSTPSSPSSSRWRAQSRPSRSATSTRPSACSSPRA